MISRNWLMVLPSGLSAERFNEWYLGTHTRYGKASLGIVRYSVNRAFSTQPPTAQGKIYRVAQEYWHDWQSFEACWNSPSGHAVLGNGLVNIGLDPAPSRELVSAQTSASRLLHPPVSVPLPAVMRATATAHTLRTQAEIISAFGCLCAAAAALRFLARTGPLTAKRARQATAPPSVLTRLFPPGF